MHAKQKFTLPSYFWVMWKHVIPKNSMESLSAQEIREQQLPFSACFWVAYTSWSSKCNTYIIQSGRRKIINHPSAELKLRLEIEHSTYSNATMFSIHLLSILYINTHVILAYIVYIHHFDILHQDNECSMLSNFNVYLVISSGIFLGIGE